MFSVRVCFVVSGYNLGRTVAFVVWILCGFCMREFCVVSKCVVSVVGFVVLPWCW